MKYLLFLFVFLSCLKVNAQEKSVSDQENLTKYNQCMIKNGSDPASQMKALEVISKLHAQGVEGNSIDTSMQILQKEGYSKKEIITAVEWYQSHGQCLKTTYNSNMSKAEKAVKQNTFNRCMSNLGYEPSQTPGIKYMKIMSEMNRMQRAQYSFERIVNELKLTYSEDEIDKAVTWTGVWKQCLASVERELND